MSFNDVLLILSFHIIGQAEGASMWSTGTDGTEMVTGGGGTPTGGDTDTGISVGGGETDGRSFRKYG